MDAKLTFLLTFLGLSLFVTLLLLLLARQGRNMRRFSDRQRFWNDLYRFIVLIVTATALYLFGKDFLPQHPLPFLPDAVVMFGTTALPMLLLCLISGRWYLGFASTLLVQGFILLHVQAAYPAFLHGTVRDLLLQNALCDLAGLFLYQVATLSQKKAKQEQEQQKHLARFLKWQRAETTKSSW